MKMGSTGSAMFRLRFERFSFVIFLLLFLVEVFIALFVKDRIIRPYGGDFLVVIMIYFFLKSFIETRYSYLLLFVFLLSYFIEFAQVFNFVGLLGLGENKLMKVVIGTSFSWGDLVAYTLGIAFCYVVERRLELKNRELAKE